MNEQTTEDDFFGQLQWNDEFQEWHGLITFPSHDEQVALQLPPEYVDSDEVRRHIRTTMPIIIRDEHSFRYQAADELFADETYQMYWPENQTFDRNVFARQMRLGSIEFNTEFPDLPLTLWYEYGKGVEHAIVIFLTWDGLYRYARSM